MNNAVTYLDVEASTGWPGTLHAFLAEKHRRSGSMRTVVGYSRMLSDFFGRSGKTPDQVTTQDAFAWAYGVGLSGKHPSSVTIGARLACLSSYLRFLIRMKVLAANSCDAIERPKAHPGLARGLSAEQIRRLLEILPDAPVGFRDRAILLTLVFTGRHRSEVLGMTAGCISFEDTVFYSYRGKGGKTGRRELPAPAINAINVWLHSQGKTLYAMDATESVWPGTNSGRGITSGTFYTNLRRYLTAAGLPASGVHVFRHSAAKLRRDVGESIEDVSRFLDHSNLATTTTYLRRLEGQADGGWAQVAELLGV